MEKRILIGQFWSWLPVFRAVAEAESLAVASRTLRLTPSALSRTIRLLEDAVGQLLFVREGRKLRLSPAGAALLPAVRRAMRVVDDGLAAMTQRAWRGTLTISAPPWFARRFVAPALALLRVDHPELRPVMTSADSALPGAALLRGEIDAAIVTTWHDDARVSRRALPPLALGVYGGEEDSPTAGVVGIDDAPVLLAAPACVTLDVAVDMSRTLEMRVTLPTAIAGGLRRWGPAARAPLEMFAVVRPEPGLAGHVIDAIAAEMSR